MKEKFPWWLWILAAIAAWPVLLAPIFLFGNPFGFDRDVSLPWTIVCIVLTNLPWLVPVITMTKSFDLYRRGWPLWAALMGFCTAIMTTVVGFYLFR